MIDTMLRSLKRGRTTLRGWTWARRRGEVWLVLALTLIAFGLRLYRLDAADLTFDETASAFNAGKSYGEMLAYLHVAVREHPPVYYMLLRAWSLLAGRSEYALRFFSVWFGVLSLPLVYRAGRKGIGQAGALVAAALLSVQPFHVLYSQEARMYTMIGLQGLVLFELFQRVRYDGRLRWWLAFGVLAAASVLTHFLIALVLAAINLYALVTLVAPPPRSSPASNRLRFGLRWFGTQAAVGGLGAVYLAWSKGAYHLVRQLQGHNWHAVAGKLEPAWGMIQDLLWGIHARPWPSWSYAIIALVGLGLALSMLRASRQGRWGRGWLPIYLLVPIALLIAMPERPYARYAATAIPAYCLTLGLAVAWLGRRHWPVGLLAFGLLIAANLNITTISQTIIKSDYGRMVEYVNRQLRPGDAVIFNGPWQWVLQLYYPVSPSAPAFWLPPDPPPRQPEPLYAQLEAIARQFERVWVLPVAVDDTDPKRSISGWLTEHAYYSPTRFKGLELYTFDHRAQPEAVSAVKLDWGNVFRIRQVNLSPTAVRPGEPLLISLPLRVLNPPGGDVAIGLELVDQDGNVWATAAPRPGQFFNPPWQWQTNDQFIARHGLLIPPGVPPGDYALRVRALLYPSEASLPPTLDGQPLPTSYLQVDHIRVLPCTDCPPVRPEDIAMTPLHATFGDGLNLVGARLAGQQFWQGHFVLIDLAWQPAGRLPQDYSLRLSLIDSAGRQVASEQAPPAASWYPTSQWAPGQLVIDRQGVLIPPRQPPGTYTLRLSVVRADGQALPVTGQRVEHVLGLFRREIDLGGNALDISQVVVRPRQRVFRAGPIAHPLVVTFGDQVRLLGYDWSGPPRPGQNARLVLYWQALREMETGYTVFTHIVGPDGTIAGQKDSWPRGGDYPTSFWMKGEVVDDEYLIPFSAQAKPGGYYLQVGLYNDQAGSRLPAVQDGRPAPGDAIILERFQISEEK